LLTSLLVTLIFATAGWLAGSARAEAAADPHAKPAPKAGKSDGDHAHGHDDHKHDPFEHLQDAWHWILLQNKAIRLEIPLHLFNKGKPDPDSKVVIFNGFSKFMVLELVAAGLICAVYIPLARRVQSGQPPRGLWDNLWESFLTFIRNDIARPNLGDHDADKYLPFLWTLFLFILFNNLLGMLPWMGSPTANLYVTGALALCSFIAMHACAAYKMGTVHYLQSLWPHMEVPFGMGYFLKPMIFVIELLGTVIKGFVLAVRLFANMFAGHTVLAMILSFILVAANPEYVTLLWGLVSGASVLGVVALSLLELFVAFLQSYIFVFLTALFMGMALHPQH
jgi:F-type H+-transporting ATPase subunit a